MNIALYARVSSDTQTKEGTIDSQIEALREYAKMHKLKITYECLDDGYSGTTLDRPGMDQLRDLAQAGEIGAILSLAPDRLSRSQPNQFILREEFKKRNVQLIFSTQSYDNTPLGDLHFGMEGLFAEYERAQIADRMRRGTIHAIKNGQVNGSNPPYGYRYIPKTKEQIGHWVINPDEEKNVRYIYHLYIVEKLTGAEIEKRLTDEAIPCRNSTWRSGLIYSILTREVYTGITYMNRRKAIEPKPSPKTKAYRKRKNTSRVQKPRDEWMAIPVPRIIDDETWNKAQELRKQNARQSPRNNKANTYLLRGLVVCGLCGSLASGYVSNKSTYYSCGAKRNKNVRSKPHDELIQVHHKPFDEQVWTGLSELLNDPKELKAQLEKRLQTRASKSISNPSASEFDKELNQLEIQEKRILDAYRQEVISLDELKEQKDKIANRRKVLEGKKKAIQSQQESIQQPKITVDMLGDVSARFQRVMAKADFPTREKIVNLLVNSVTLHPNKAIVKGNIPIDKLDALATRPLRGDARRAERSITMPHDPAYLLAKKRIKEARYSFSLCTNGKRI